MDSRYIHIFNEAVFNALRKKESHKNESLLDAVTRFWSLTLEIVSNGKQPFYLSA